MKLKFISLLIWDFKSFEGKHKLQLDVPPGVHFIRGRNKAEPRLEANGTGKSSLWDALVWCLYGRTTAGLRNPDIIPWKGKATTRVKVIVEIDKTIHTIRRTASPNSLACDGLDVGQEVVDRLIGLDFTTMTNTFILGQGRPLFFDMTATEKMQLLADVKGLDKWDARAKAAAEACKDLETKLSQLSASADSLSRCIDDATQDIRKLKPQEEEWRTQYERRLEEADKFIERNSKAIEDLEREVAGFDLKYDSAMVEVKACERQVAKLSDELATSRANLNEAVSKRARAEEVIAQLSAELKSLATAKRCPTCGSAVTQKNLQAHRFELQQKIDAITEGKSRLKIKPLRAAVDTAGHNLAHNNRYLEGFHSKADGAQREYKAVQTKLLSLKAKLTEIQKSACVDQPNPYAQQLRDLRKKRDRLIVECGEKEKEERLCQLKLERTKYWVKGFKDIKLHVVEELLQELELATSGMLEEVGLIGWSVKYLIERETKSGKTQRALSVQIGSPKSPPGKLVRWESWSGGEGQRLRVVGNLALAEVLLSHANVKPNIEVLDEPTRSLSEQGRRDLCDYLADRASQRRIGVFYCDHESVDGAAFASTITVSRDASGSHIAGGPK